MGDQNSARLRNKTVSYVFPEDNEDSSAADRGFLSVADLLYRKVER